ncbi:MAG: hypothetical protein JNJ94_13790 [Chlorobi bacterium]|nr:hypothetical protein [Chlorobiota bacterium]
MNTADIITSFFNNELSAEQERQFLLSVAASDSMRLGLKSHVMLDKILADNASDLHISDSVRNTIFAEAESVLANNTAGNGASTIGGRSSGGGAWWQGVRAAFSAKVAAGGVAVALAGFGLGYATHSQLADASVASSPVQPIVPVPITLRDQSDAVPVPSSTTSTPTNSFATAKEAPRTAAASRTGSRHSALRSVVSHSAAATPTRDTAPAAATPSLTTPAQLPELPALRQGEDLLQSAAAATTDSINNQSSVRSYDGLPNQFPDVQVKAKHSKPNRDSNNQKPQGSTTTP